ncbi:MAG: hypothetical protein HFI90_05745 [Clostridia bacterium]|nr:hypothetical protein [Clostridia bacterium]
MKIGLLPLYVKLYDKVLPQMRERLEGFYGEIAEQFESQKIQVVRAPFCRLKAEFGQAVQEFETQNVDAVVTLHMAYSPSLESIDALAETALPIVVLDTTQTLEFTGEQNPDEISYCHGIHGVMDMCSMLTRRGKCYAIAAGHYLESDCIARVCGYVRAAKAARALQGMRVGMVGGAFEGMGDFAVSFEELAQRFGIQVLPQSREILQQCRSSVTEAQMEAELARDREQFDFDGNVDWEEYRQSVLACLTMRRCLEQEKLNAFSVNFTQVGEASGLDTMPFIECCKAMERGIGYAGEGDALTAALTGALMQGWQDTNFVEIFCPDWQNNLLFLSHMGEVNYRVAATKPQVCRAGVNYTPGPYPYMGYTRMKAGQGVYVNISRGQQDYKLTLAAAEMIEPQRDNFTASMRGWMKPQMRTARFLEGLSENGATHHSVFVYGAKTEELIYFGRLLGLETVELNG